MTVHSFILKTLVVSAACLSITAVAAPPSNADIEAGRAIVEGNCGACHGVNGVSIAPAQPNLGGQNFRYLYKQLVDFKQGKRANGIMKAQLVGLNQQDLINVAAYYSSQTPWGPGYGNPETTHAATKLYLGGDKTRGVIPCAGCHNPKGIGNEWAGFPRLGGQHAAYIATQLRMFRAAGREDEGLMEEQLRHNDSPKREEKGMMQTVASHLTDKDIRILSDYISALH